MEGRWVDHTRSVDVVVNVKPNAADASFADYSRDLGRALQRVVTDAGSMRP